MRTHPRRRHEFRPLAFAFLRPFRTYSYSRDAWILVGVGNRFGPVIRRRASRTEPVNGGEHPPAS